MENTKDLKFSVSICVYGGDNPDYLGEKRSFHIQ